MNRTVVKEVTISQCIKNWEQKTGISNIDKNEFSQFYFFNKIL